MTVPIEEIDLAADRLWQLGVQAIEERSIGSDLLELWTSVGSTDEAAALAAMSLDVRWNWRMVEVPLAPAENWREHSEVVHISDTLTLIPAWIDHDDRPEAVSIRIEPGGAFGLGDHPTTRLCAAMLEASVTSGIECGIAPSVLDVGCGTGVLSIIAALIGASTVRAIDVSDDAVESTVRNASTNGVDQMINVDATAYASIPGSFDIVVANVLAPVLIAASVDLLRLTALGGTLIVSGILADSHSHVRAALAPMIVNEVRTLNGWAAISLRHP